MKVTVFPTKEAVTGMLSAQLGSIQKRLDEAKADLSSLEAKKAESRIHNSYADADLSRARSMVAALEEEEGNLQDKIALLESSETATVDFDL